MRGVRETSLQYGRDKVLEKMVFAIELPSRTAPRMFMVVLEMRSASLPIRRSRKLSTTVSASIQVSAFQKQLLNILDIVT
jgi:hypothetical protein